MSVRVSLAVLACGLLGGTALAAEPAKHVDQSGGWIVTTPPAQSLQLSDADQKAIIDDVLPLGQRQSTPKDYKAEVGSAVPKAIQVEAFQPVFEQKMPMLKNFMYAHLDKEIVLIDALQLKTAAVVPLSEDLQVKGGPSQAQQALNWYGGLANVSAEQKQAIYQAVANAPGPKSTAETTGAEIGTGKPVGNDNIAIRAGIDVPSNITTSPLPADVGEQVQAVKDFTFAKLSDGRLLLADPKTNKVAGLITREEGNKGKKAELPGSNDPNRHLEDSGNASAYTGPNEKR